MIRVNMCVEYIHKLQSKVFYLLEVPVFRINRRK